MSNGFILENTENGTVYHPPKYPPKALVATNVLIVETRVEVQRTEVKWPACVCVEVGLRLEVGGTDRPSGGWCPFSPTWNSRLIGQILPPSSSTLGFGVWAFPFVRFNAYRIHPPPQTPPWLKSLVVSK
jgi:hypothetical protein